MSDFLISSGFETLPGCHSSAVPIKTAAIRVQSWMRLLFLSLLLGFFFCPAHSASNPVTDNLIFIDSSFRSLEINECFELYEDSSQLWRNKGIRAFSDKQDFEIYCRRFFKKRSDYPFALRFRIKTGNISENDFILDFQHADIDRMQLMLCGSTGDTFVSKFQGDRYPFSERYIQHRFFAFPIRLRPNSDYHLYLLISKPRKFITTRILFATGSYWRDHSLTINFRNGIVLGLFFSFITLGLIMFFILYEYIYVYYSLYAFAVLLILFSIHGYSYQFLFPCLPHFQQYFMVLVQLAGLIFLNLYAFEFTGLNRADRLAERLKKVFIFFYIGFGILTLSFIGHDYTADKPLSYLLLIVELFNFLMLFFLPLRHYYIHRQPASLVFIISFLFPGVSLVYSTFSFLIPGAPYLLLSEMLPPSLFLEMLVLSAFMISRYKSILSRKKIAESELESERQKNLAAYTEGQEQEKRDLAQFLHDHLGSQLVLVLQRIRKHLTEFPEDRPAAELLSDAEERIKVVNAELRTLSHQLLPVSLETLSLSEAMEQLGKEYSAHFTTHFFDQAVPDSLAVNIRLQFYRILQELFKNSLLHGEPSNVYLQLIHEDGFLELQYEDDGRGFDLSQWNAGIGFRSIRLRTELLRGRLQIESSPGEGVWISVRIPFSQYHGFGDTTDHS